MVYLRRKKNLPHCVGPRYSTATGKRVQIVSWGSNETTTFSKAGYDYFAVWTFPETETTQQLETMVEGAGWYNYFDQVNAMGTATIPQEVIRKMIDI